MKKLSLLALFFLVLICNYTNIFAEKSVWDKNIEPLSAAENSLEIKVYHSPSCGCCKGWIAHLEKHNFKVHSVLTDDVAVIKTKHGLPKEAASCHTAIIDGYVIEGHVPANDIKRLIKDKPDIAGLTVPQMPVGTPGMEMGERKDPFNVIAFDKKGNFDIFQEYKKY